MEAPPPRESKQPKPAENENSQSRASKRTSKMPSEPKPQVTTESETASDASDSSKFEQELGDLLKPLEQQRLQEISMAANNNPEEINKTPVPKSE